MLYRTRSGFGQSLELPDGYIRIELYNKSDGQMAGALPHVISITYDDVNHAWIVTDADHATPWTFSCSLYYMYIYPAD